ncbi:MAG: glycosyltransferase [Calothrix sp. C42_A2020_038]|nr:glycosyltransferase [Calothrix sp. C42_A2020_038]
MSIKVSIVIPIYNAYDDTKQCLESVLKYTDSRHEILLVNDGSTDIRISELCRLFGSENPNIKILFNSENLGFVRTCNRAFGESNQQTDLILLNSDTIVTPNWVEKLISAAYSSRYIATVTPLTNNGTICSVPTWLEYNDIPEGHDILSFANLIEKISLRKYPCIPTAVGFCMYITRAVLDKIGYFDAVNFHRGYGEENDFCCRATKQGYLHIIDDATFIYHAGSKSFKAEKQKLIDENSKILAKLHPRYFPEVRSLIQANPFKDILDNIRLHLQIEQFKKLSPICFILHNGIDIPINNPLGGTEYHCAALATNISQQRPVYILYFNQSLQLLEFDIFYKQQKLNFKFPIQIQSYYQRYFNHNSQLLRTLIGIFEYFQPSLIHVHHLIGLSIVDVTTAINQVNIPYIVSLHDYYLICPSQNLIDYHEKFCFEHKNPDYCRTCIQSLFNQGEELKQQWSILSQHFLEGATTIIAPSQTALSYFLQDYPQLQQKSKVINHGIYSQEELQVIKQNTNTHNVISGASSKFHTLRVALVGSINIAKGSKIFIELLNQAWQKKDLAKSLHFDIIGRYNLILPEHVKNVTINSEYNKKDLGNMLKEIDVAIFPNIWAETYCLTVDETLAHGVPVIVTDISAASARVQKYKVGWISHPTAADLLDVLVDIKNNPSELVKVRNNIKNYPFISYEQMAQQYLNEYAKISNHDINSNAPSITAQEITQSHCFTSYRTITVSQDEQFELRKLDLMIRAMETSKWWKLRVALLRLKQKFGIAIDDLWMRERGSNYK